MKTAKISLKLVRAFSFGFTIYSPKLNGFCFCINVACFTLSVWNRGDYWFEIKSYWNG